MAQGYQQQQQQWGARPAHGGGSGKGLPIAIGAGLAIGVFVGLLVIRGTGAEAGQGTASAEIDAGATTTANVVDAAPAAAVPDAAPAVDAAPAKPPAPVLTFAVAPADLPDLEITVDGEAITGTSYEVALPEGKTERRVKVRAKARGYRTFSRRVTITASQTLEITLKKRGRTGGGTTTTPGGLIDL